MNHVIYKRPTRGDKSAFLPHLHISKSESYKQKDLAVTESAPPPSSPSSKKKKKMLRQQCPKPTDPPAVPPPPSVILAPKPTSYSNPHNSKSPHIPHESEYIST